MLGQAHIEQKNLHAAREIVATELMRDPISPIGHYGEAMISTTLGMPLEAASHLLESLKTAPDNHVARYELALNYFRRGMNVDAIAELETIAAQRPDFPDLSMRLQAFKVMTDAWRHSPDADNYQPIFLLAPVARCGSTFLQRLVASSGKAVIFGENADLTKRLPECVEEASCKIVSPQTAIPGSGKDYFAMTLRNFYRIIDFYQKVGNKTGRAWGLKDPYSRQMGTLRSLLPSAKFIFLYRNLFDVARSYKARGWLKSKFSVIQLARDWQEEIRKGLLCGDRNILAVRYEHLIADPEPIIAKIEDFTGLTGIKRETLKIKVNNPGENYLLPQVLTDDERQLLSGHAAIMLARLDYS